jgi:hypothetical protein
MLLMSTGGVGIGIVVFLVLVEYSPDSKSTVSFKLEKLLILSFINY